MRWEFWGGAPEQRSLRDVVKRRRGWFLDGLTPPKLANMVVAGAEYAAKRTVLRGWPIALKIDISPCCNLNCPTCVHGKPSVDHRLENQEFRPDQRMSVDQFEGLVREVQSRSTIVSLYYLGDPLMHPDLCEMCSVARSGGLNVHIGTSFSFRLSDEQIRQLVTSGLTHLTVCVDGLSQETYGLTRVGGRVDRVLSNLRRACAFRQGQGRNRPRIEVQYIRFQHNVDELGRARDLFAEMGVDDVVSFWGSLHNYLDCDPGTYAVHGPRKQRLLPWCYWPYFFMVVKYDGSVIPCCNHRIGSQYSRTESPRTLGNVFETSVLDVWNSPTYQALRRLVSDSELSRSEPRLRASFCDECARVFDTARELNVRSAEDYTLEELYEVGADGVSRRSRGGDSR